MMLDAVIDIQQQTYDTAVLTLNRLAQRQPDNVRVGELLARALWLGGRDDELIARFGPVATAPDASPYLTMLVGRAYERRGDRARAAPLIEQAFAAREVRLAVLTGMDGIPPATANLRRGIKARNAQSAAQETAQLLDRFGGSSDYLALAADAALATDDKVTALLHYTQAARVRRPWPMARKMIFALRSSGDDRAADALLTRIVLGEPRNTEALLMLAQRSAEAQEWERVATLSNLVFALGAGNDPRVLDLQAKAAEALGRTEQAARWDVTAEAVRPGRFVRRN